MLITALNIADVFFRPMTLFADLLRRARISRRKTNRPVEIVSHGVIKLLHAIDFGFEIRGRAGTDMTSNALHARVGGVLKGNELRLHRKMARLSAELN